MNYTPNYDLPLYQDNDETSWLSTWNDAMSAIDSALADIRASIDGSVTGVADAKAAADSAAASATAAQNSATIAQGLAATANTNANAALGVGNTLMGRSGDIIMMSLEGAGPRIQITPAGVTITEDGLYECNANHNSSGNSYVSVGPFRILTNSSTSVDAISYVPIKSGQLVTGTDGNNLRKINGAGVIVGKYNYEVTE